MSFKAKLKKRRGLIFSILFHLLLLLGAFHALDKDRALPTSTKGYQVELVHSQDIPPATPPSAPVPPSTSSSMEPAAVPSQLNAKAEINLKAADPKKKTLTKEQLAAQKAAEAKRKAEREALRKQRAAYKAAEAKLAREQRAQAAAKQQQQATPANEVPKEQHGVNMTNKNQAQIAASAPTGSSNQVGDGGETNSSTDGTGTHAGAFDFRVIEYGRDAAYAINQNIVIPAAYQYTHVTYRAFVTLDQNMQFQSMHMVSSTGSTQFDTNIAKALRETVYPPLPHGADWHEFHNIDFTIK